MLNKLIHFDAFSAETTAVEETTLVETEFAGSTVPVGTTILFGAGLLLLAVAAIAVIVYLRNHVKNWAYPMYAGAIFYLLFSYIVIQLVSVGLSFLPAVRQYAEAHKMSPLPPWYEMSRYGLRIVTDCVALFLGIRYMRNSSVKRRIEPVIGHAFSFGVACYIAYVLVSGAFSGYFNLITQVGFIKSNGYQRALTDFLVNNPGLTKELGERFLNWCIQPDVARVLFSPFVNREFWGSIPGIWPTMVMLAVYIASSVLVYGFQIKKLGVKWLLAAFVLVALNWIPYIPSIVLDLPAWATGIWYAALLGLSILALWAVFKKELKDELEAFKYSRTEEQQKAYQQTHKMPKIVMPREEDRQPVGSAGVDTREADKEAEEARKEAEDAFGMTEEEAEALLAEEEADEAQEAGEVPEDGRKEES